jgi:hypothetical protein
LRTNHYIALHCIALHCIALHCIALHCIALHCIALHCIALHYITLYYITLHYIVFKIPEIKQEQTSPKPDECISMLDLLSLKRPLDRSLSSSSDGKSMFTTTCFRQLNFLNYVSCFFSLSLGAFSQPSKNIKL